MLEPRVTKLLDELEPDADALRVGAALRRALPQDLARAAAEQHALRARAQARFPDARAMLLTSQGLEQATHPRVAGWRARRFAEHDARSAVWDATCGIGSDARALARAGRDVVASDRDAATALCARVNTDPRRVAVVRADARRPPIAALGEALVLVDPDRRAGGRRSLDPHEWSPSLDAVVALLGGARGGCAKLAPSFDPDGVTIEGDHAWEWVSRRGEAAELGLWTGALAPGARGDRRATLLAPDGTEHALEGERVELRALPPERAATVAWIAEPDPAVLLAGLLGAVAEPLELAPLGPGLAFVGGRNEPRSPFLRRWRVVASSSADGKRVRAMLSAHGVGSVDVLKRGHPESPEALARKFRGRGERRGVVLVARTENGHRAYLVDPVPSVGR